MKEHICFLSAVCLIAVTSANAAEVVKPVKDNVAGSGVGALSGLMVGGAAGGPLGGVVGAGLGWWMGAKAQDVAGLSQTAYEIKDESGELKHVRSPNRQFAVGEQVDYHGGRIHRKNSNAESLVE